MSAPTLVREPTRAGVPAVSPAVERDVRWELAAALRTFGRLGYEFGFNGHVSARAVERPGHYWVNPFGLSVSVVTPADLVLVDGDGDVVDPQTSRGINGFAGNLALHREIHDAAVVIHLHTESGFIWSNLGRPLAAVNTDSALITGLQGVSSRIWDGSGDTLVDLAHGGSRVLLQRGHGFVTWGSTVGEAAFYLVAAERAATANLALLDAVGAQPLGAEATARWTLQPDVARAHFEPYFTRQEAEGVR